MSPVRSVSRLCVVAIGCLTGLGAPGAVRAQAVPKPGAGPVAWHDPSPHRVRMIPVAPDVVLEVLDWGGTGDPIVFLHGFGNSAHSFDDFAPKLTDHYHVYGITRRGNGISSHPANGNDITTLVTDVRTVLDTLGIKRAHLVGHSFGGQMLNKFVQLFPDRVRTLVYLDAAFDSKNLIEPLPAPPRPPATTDELGSSAGMRAYLFRIEGVWIPEAEIRTMFAFDPDGKAASTKHPRNPGWEQTNLSEEHADWSHVAAPALAIYNLDPQTDHMYTWYASMDSATRVMADRYDAYWYGWSKQQAENFRKEVPHGEVIEIANSRHFVFTANEPEVEHAMRDFYLKH